LQQKSPKKTAWIDELTPFGCPECHGHHVCVDTTLACLVCRKCGLQGAIGFEHPYRNFNGKDTKEPFQYQPVAYMLRLLDQIQGNGAPGVSKDEWQAIQEHLRARQVCDADITPTHVLHALQHLRLCSLYTHRWYLTRKLNPQYIPLRVPHKLEERVRAVFVAAYERFVRLYVRGSTRRRKFPSYLMFIQIVLQYLGIPDIDRHFTPPTNVRNRRVVSKMICDLVKAL